MKEYDFLTTPIVDIVNNIIMDAVDMNASDIHFDCSENFLKIRIRVDGELRDYSIIDNKYKRNLITRIKLLSGMNITESRLPQDGAIKGIINGKDLDMRVSCLPTIFGEKVVIRILDYSMSLQGIESLGFTEENYNIILKMLANPNGIILVTGATGSGKSTTTYAMLQRLNSEETNIITVEDPVEMNIEGVNQVQVNSEIGLDFANVLRSILRQDPNIILIGEIRDTETAQIAIRSSITGHLVLSTLHTNNSLTSIERLLDMNVERYLLSASLKGIISQNLARKLCPKCKIKRPTTDAEKRLFKKQLNMDVDEIYDHGTCSECRNGFKGRIALQEVLLINDEIRDAINDSMKRANLREMIYGRGVKTLLQDGLIKVTQGITSLDEVLKIVEAENDDDSNVYANDDNEENNNINDIKDISNNPFFNKLRSVDEEIEEIERIINNNKDINNTSDDNNEIIEDNKNIDTLDNNVVIDDNMNNLNSNLSIPNYNISDTVKEPIKKEEINEKEIVPDLKIEDDDLENTQDIFASLWEDNTKNNKNNDYITMNDIAQVDNDNEISYEKHDKNHTNDLINLINNNLNDIEKN